MPLPLLYDVEYWALELLWLVECCCVLFDELWPKAYPRAAPPANVDAELNLLGLGGLLGLLDGVTSSSSTKPPGMVELEGRCGFGEDVSALAP